MKRPIFVLALTCLLMSIFALTAEAGYADSKRAAEMGGMLVELFSPESIEVTISEGGSFAWVEAQGAVIDKMRVDNLKLRAMIKNIKEPIDRKDSHNLAKLILMSNGELTLLEKDVNKLFSGDIETKGFSNLVFDFQPTGFKAEGLFTAKFIVAIRIRLRAVGVLKLHDDGIYVENIEIFTEGVKSPEGLVRMVADRINPLLAFDKIPFPVAFNKLTMMNGAVVLTGNPERFTGGSVWRWKKK